MQQAARHQHATTSLPSSPVTSSPHHRMAGHHIIAGTNTARHEHQNTARHEHQHGNKSASAGTTEWGITASATGVPPGNSISRQAARHQHHGGRYTIIDTDNASSGNGIIPSNNGNNNNNNGNNIGNGNSTICNIIPPQHGSRNNTTRRAEQQHAVVSYQQVIARSPSSRHDSHGITGNISAASRHAAGRSTQSGGNGARRGARKVRSKRSAGRVRQRW